MHKFLVLSLISVGLLGGCMSPMPDGNGLKSWEWNEQLVLTVGNEKLIGQVTTISGVCSKCVSYYRMTQQLEASNGVLVCTTPLYESFGTFDGSSYDTAISCSDGSSGRMRVTVERWQDEGVGPGGYKGLGIGKLSNGKDLRLVFGPSTNITNTGF